MHLRAPSLACLLLLVACSAGPDGSDAGGGSDGGDVTGDGGSGGDAGAADAGPDDSCDPNTFDNENGVPCEGLSTGTCAPGARFCTEEGKLTACYGRRQPLPGDCTRLNCLGELNEGCTCVIGTRLDCYSGDETALGHGVCRRGVSICAETTTGSAFGPCVGEVLPLTEDCSHRGLSCSADPEVDCACTSGNRPCAGVTGGTCVLGHQTCNAGTWGDCEDFVQPDVANCDVPSCLSTEGHPVPNPGCDCISGATLECYTGLPGTLGVGTCAKGTRSCVDGRWSEQCVGQVAPRPFYCDEPSCVSTTGHPVPNPGCE